MSSLRGPFRLTWNIEVFNKDIFKCGSSLKSVSFRVESLRNTRWYVKLSREGAGDEDWIICDLRSKCTLHDPETVYLHYRLYIDVKGRKHFEKVANSTKYGHGCHFRVPFIPTQSLNCAHYPDDTLVVVCEMTAYKVRDQFCVAENLKRLSKDTAVLHINKLYSDLIVSTDDHQVFEVHRFVLHCRWKEAISLLPPSGNEAHVSGVSGSVFGSFLRYLYCGKLSSRVVSPELFEFASQNCQDLGSNLRSLSNALSTCTRSNIQRKVLRFRLGSWTSLSRVVPLIGIYSPELQINVDLSEGTGEDYLDISFWFSDFQLDRPIYLRCGISLVEGTESGYRLSATKHHVFARGEEWRFPPFIRKSEVAMLSNWQLVLTLDIGDILLPPTVKTSLTVFRTGSLGVYDLNSLSKDFRQASKETSCKDIVIDTGNVAFLRHKAMLSARSSIFRNLLEWNTSLRDILTINVPPFDYVPVMHLLEYIYSGSISNLTREDVVNLKCLSECFRMDKLEESCCIYLASDSNGI